jgi:hypothetical protein
MTVHRLLRHLAANGRLRRSLPVGAAPHDALYLAAPG